MKLGRCLICVALLTVTIACSQTRAPKTSAVATPAPSTTPENYPALAAQAKEISDALLRKDFDRLMDLTFPKVLEVGGGREKMMAQARNEMKETEAQGVTVLSSTVSEPTQIIHDAGSIYAVVVNTLKLKARDGVFQTESTLIGVSSDNGANWTFVDASGSDTGELKKILPAVANQLKLPPDKPAVKISNGN